jgi:hypothetical protein
MFRNNPLLTNFLISIHMKQMECFGIIVVVQKNSGKHEIILFAVFPYVGYL